MTGQLTHYGQSVDLTCCHLTPDICPRCRLYGKASLSLVSVISKRPFEIVSALSRQYPFSYLHFPRLEPCGLSVDSLHIRNPVPPLGADFATRRCYSPAIRKKLITIIRG